ncbi:hypothetical protein CHS0354_016278 [Potamilus streckersoni]|uniref:Uncharacterized protein n=1 Tax=Potamilus streckersoni TaxID=2493646 RepID=A0AAE0VKX9_9BIVA|nr:hypothetical protein CHS0354_016278 [Potamilus streckersoni]
MVTQNDVKSRDAQDFKNTEFERSGDVEVTPNFDCMGIREELLRGIYAYVSGHTSQRNTGPHSFPNRRTGCADSEELVDQVDLDKCVATNFVKKDIARY